MTKVYLGLGSNLGDRAANLAKAMELLSRRIKVERLSSLYETEPVGYTSQPRFLNAVCSATTELSPRELLTLAKGIERELGREKSFPNAPRPIDIDILFYGETVLSEPELTLPHPRLTERAFVLVPLAEISPELVHPASGVSVLELLKSAPGQKGVRRWQKAGQEVKMKIREFTMKDYDRMWQLWRLCHIPLAESDSPERTAEKLKRDPDLFLVAEMNEAIMGVVMGSWDGRLAWIYNQAVDPCCRRMGVGSQLMSEIERRLQAKGATRINLLIEKTNLEAEDFYQSSGFSVEEGYTLMIKQLPQNKS